MGNKDQSKEKEKVVSVLETLRKQAPLTVKQEKFCNSACVERFLRAKGDSVKKAAKHLRACFSWRESIGTENLIADEFSSELAEGIAYVAGHDEEFRPVLIFRIKQDYQKFHSQKQFTRLLVFTLEVAIGAMHRGVEQFVLLLDASFFRSASSFMNLLLAPLKILAEYYPGRLHRAFVIDPPSLFSYLWKGVRPFVELSSATSVVSSLDFEDAFEFDDFSTYPRASSLRFDPSSVQSTAKIGSCSSSRFTFTVSHHFDSLKPWYLSFADTSSASSRVGPTTAITGSPSPSSVLGPALISPLNARSLSFASPGARTTATPRGAIGGGARKVGFFPSTPMPEKAAKMAEVSNPRTPARRPSSFFQSPATFFGRKECHVGGKETFASYVKLYRRPYDEMTYRSKMRPPLGGLVSIVHPSISRRHVSLSQRF